MEVDPEFAADFETAMDGFPCACIGVVTEEKRLTATCCGGEKVLDCDIANLKNSGRTDLPPIIDLLKPASYQTIDLFLPICLTHFY